MCEKVSIITPMYNSEAFIEETILSVLKQTYTNWEMIIIDDFSTDNSIEIVKRYQKRDERIKLIELKENKGVVNARNEGIRNAEGEYIAFLDSDDLWHELKLQNQIRIMKENNALISCTSYQKMEENGIKRGVIRVKENISYKELLKTNSMGCLTVIYNAKRIGKKYFKEIDKSEDYVLWLDILKETGKAIGIDEVLAYYRVRKNSKSSNKLKVINYQWKIYRNIEKLSMKDSIYYFINYLYYGIKKYYL